MNELPALPSSQSSRREYWRNYARANPEQRRTSRSKYYYSHKEKVSKRTQANGRASREALRNQMLDLLGSRCAACGEDERLVLCVDHIEGGGGKEREGSRGCRYRRLLREISINPLGFQSLCHNCNWVKRHERKEWGTESRGLTAGRDLERSRKYRQRLKQQLVDALDGGRCRWCGFDDIRALHIDHVFGGGTEDKRRRGNSFPYGQYLSEVQAGSEEYEVLCANCNFAKERVGS